jgi:RNA polymerase sigma factor (TIGR02999 family)
VNSATAKELVRSDVTRLLDRVSDGDADAFDSLIEAVYGELRQVAGALLHARDGSATLQPTCLVHEAWLNLQKRPQRWDGRAHFFGAAARAMRQVIVAHARHHAAQKRCGERVTFDDMHVECAEPSLDVIAVHEALAALAVADARLARVMEMRYFGGLTLAEIGELEERSLATIKRDWLYARAWLYDYMRTESEVQVRVS